MLKKLYRPEVTYLVNSTKADNRLFIFVLSGEAELHNID